MILSHISLDAKFVRNHLHWRIFLLDTWKVIFIHVRDVENLLLYMNYLLLSTPWWCRCRPAPRRTAASRRRRSRLSRTGTPGRSRALSGLSECRSRWPGPCPGESSPGSSCWYLYHRSHCSPTTLTRDQSHIPPPGWSSLEMSDFNFICQDYIYSLHSTVYSLQSTVYYLLRWLMLVVDSFEFRVNFTNRLGNGMENAIWRNLFDIQTYDALWRI